MAPGTVKHITEDDLPDIYNTYLREIVAFVYNFVRDEDEAQELTQDVFYKLCVDVNNNRVTGENIRAYLYKAARNLCINELRKKGIEKVPYINGVSRPRNEAVPEEQLVDAMLIDDIYVFIEKSFAETENTVFKLRYYYNLNLQEISDILDSSVPTVSRIIKNISKKIEDEFHDAL